MSDFIAGVGLVAHVSTFLWCGFGAALGIILGALPGLTATMGIALVIPVSYQLDTLPSRRFFLESQATPMPSPPRRTAS